jgi:glycosyltransferase involved in cell wall biosynthesis
MTYLILITIVVCWIVIYYLALQNKQNILNIKSTYDIGSNPSLISIIIPARNEAATLPVCLVGIEKLDYPTFEVIIVDDHSTDKTPAIAESASRIHSNFNFIQSKDLPSGWTGKNWTNYQGAHVARGEWLLFTDADAQLYPNALSNSVAYALDKQVDMLSLLPKTDIVNFWDKITLPIVGGLIMASNPLDKVNDPKASTAMAIGAFILIRRSVYEAVDGHSAIKGKIVDDRELALLVKRAGYVLRVMDGAEIYQVCMYESFKDLWEGWSKNLFLGMDKSYWRAGATILAVFFLYVFPVLALVGWLFANIATPTINLGQGAMIILANLIILRIMTRIHRLFDLKFSSAYVGGWPLGGIIVMGLITNSILSHFRGISWKGRTY